MRERTLQRQFPLIHATDASAVLELFDRLGPIQSQAPRSPFLTVSSRLPGVGYETVNGLFESHHLLKTTNLRGTVHTSTRRWFGLLDAVARHTRAKNLRRELRLKHVSPTDVDHEIERFCASEFKPREEIVDHVYRWVNEREESGQFEDSTQLRNLIWGHSGLIRRPRDQAWQKRTDAFHQTASARVPDLIRPEPEVALRKLIRNHLAVFGPCTRHDLAFFFGTGLTQIDEAITSLGDDIEWRQGPDQADYVDLIEPPLIMDRPLGVRLLPEFDGLVMGYSGTGRSRFIREEQLSRLRASANGLSSPAVLFDDRIVASWRTVGSGRRTYIDVVMFDGEAKLDIAILQPQLESVAAALNLEITDVSVRVPD